MSMEDAQIIQFIRDGEREKPIRFLYKEFPKIKTMILKEGLTKELAEEIFQNSLILLIEKIENPAFELTAKMTTYLYGVNRFLAKNESKKQRKSQQVEWTDAYGFDDSDFSYDYEKEEKLKQLEFILTKISERCQRIFKLFYFEKKSMSEIAKTLDFSSTNSAKTQKYKCMERAIVLSKKTEDSLEHSIQPN